MLLSMSPQYQSTYRKLYEALYEQIGRIHPDAVKKTTMTELITQLCIAEVKNGTDFDDLDRKFFKDKQRVLITNLVAEFKK